MRQLHYRTSELSIRYEFQVLSIISERLLTSLCLPIRPIVSTKILEKGRSSKKLILGSVLRRCRSVYFLLQSVQPKLHINPLNAELNHICCLLALLGAHHFFHVSRIRVKSLTLRILMSYIYGAPILDVSRSHTTTQHSR